MSNPICIPPLPKEHSVPSDTMKRRTSRALLAALVLGILPAFVAPASAAACSSTLTTYTGNGSNGTNGVVYSVRKFTTTGSCEYYVPAGVTSMDLLVVGGGGGGQGDGGGGGGGGELTWANGVSITSSTQISVQVGAGGVYGYWQGPSAAPGGTSSVSWSGSTYSAVGGGGGPLISNGRAFGGTGGAGGSHQQGAQAGSASLNDGNHGDNGANGYSNSITGSAVTYSGGGGGGIYSNSCIDIAARTGGAGGGGNGSHSVLNSGQTKGVDGVANSGGGGGGGSAGNGCGVNYQNARMDGGSGGSGIVILRYVLAVQAPSVSIATTSGSGERTVGQQVTFTATASNTVGSTTYAWYRTGAAGTVLSTATTYTRTLVDGDNGSKYYCVVTNTVDGTPASTASSEITVAMVAAPTIDTSASLPQSTVGLSYSQAIAGSKYSTGSATWSSSGTPPLGITFDDTSHSFSGTSTTAGTYTPTVTFTDGNGSAVSRQFTIVIVAAPTISAPASFANGTWGAAYSDVTLTGNNHSAGAGVWAAATGLPAGMSFDTSTAKVTGTPTATGDFNAGFTFTDGNGASVTRNYSLHINAPTPIVSTPNASTIAKTEGQSVTLSVSASPSLGAAGSYDYVWKRGTTVVGTNSASLELASLSTSDAGAYTCVVTATVGSETATTTMSVTTLSVGSAPTIDSPASLPAGTWGTAYSQTVVGTVHTTGSGTWSWSGTLPTGVTFNAGTHTFGGTPTATGSYSGTVTFTDANGATATRTFTLAIGAPSPAVSTAVASSIERSVGQSLTLSVSASTTPSISGSGTLSYEWKRGSTVVGTDSDTLTLNTLSASDAGTYTVTVTATVGSATASTTFTVTALAIAGAPSITSSTLPIAPLGVVYATSLAGTASGSATWSLVSGSLPTGLALASDGTIAGTPTAPANASFTVRLTDGNGAYTEAALTLSTERISMSLSINSASITYGEATPTFTVQVTGLHAGDAVTTSWTINGSSSAPTNAGTYTVVPVVTFTSGSASSYDIAVTNGTYTIGRAQSWLSALVLPSATYGDGEVAFTLPSQYGGGLMSVYSSNTAVASVRGSTLIVHAAGQATITVAVSGTQNFYGTSVSATFTVAKAQQQPITLTGGGALLYGSTTTVSASGGSTEAGPITYVSEGACSMSDAVVRGADAGTCTVWATRVESANYLGIRSNALMFVVSPVALTITLHPSASVYAEPLPAIAFTTAGLVPGDAVIAVHGIFTAANQTKPDAGTYELRGSEAIFAIGKSTGYVITWIATELTVSRAKPAYGAFTIPALTYGDAPMQIQAPGTTSDGVITYTSADETVVRVSGALLTVIGAGTTTIRATQPQTRNYEAGEITATVEVAKAKQASVNIIGPATLHYGEHAAYTITGGSIDAAEMLLLMGGPCTDAGNVITATGIGTCSLVAIRAGDANYLGVVTDAVQIPVLPAALTITVKDASKYEGSIDPAPALLVRGLVNGDTVDALTITRAAGEVPGAYAYAVNAKSALNYVITMELGSLTVLAKRAPAFAWSGATTITYGTPLSTSAVFATASLAGTVTYTLDGAAFTQATLLAPGMYALQANFTPADASTTRASTSTATIIVTPKLINVAGVVVKAKLFDGTADAVVDCQRASLVGVVQGDDVLLNTAQCTGAFPDAAVGAAKPVYVSGIALSGASASRYTLAPITLSADIQPTLMGTADAPFTAAQIATMHTNVEVNPGSNITFTYGKEILGAVQLSVTNSSNTTVLECTNGACAVGFTKRDLTVVTATSVVDGVVSATPVLAMWSAKFVGATTAQTRDSYEHFSELIAIARAGGSINVIAGSAVDINDPKRFALAKERAAQTVRVLRMLGVNANLVIDVPRNTDSKEQLLLVWQP